MKLNNSKQELREEIISTKLSELVKKSIVKKVPNKKFGLLLSGGLDSSIIAFVLKEYGNNFNCYVIEINNGNFKKSEDIEYSKRFSEEIGLNTKIIYTKREEIKKAVQSIIKIIPNIDVVKLSIALPVYLCFKQAKKDGCKIVFIGTGSDTLFAGFNRYRRIRNINKICRQDLEESYKKINLREKVLADKIGIGLIFPFLDKELVEYSLNIPGKYKIKNDIEKYILRKAAEKMGLPKYITERKKKAIQYSSNSQKSLKKLAKIKGFNKIGDYIDSLRKK